MTDPATPRPDQDQDTAAGDAAQTRPVSSVKTLKALADPVRLAILTVLMQGPGPLRVMPVKELAAELGEPQTKLYRHVRHLEEAGLIRVAATRMVSGIAEQQYQACQASLAFGAALIGDPGSADEAGTMITAMLDRFRERFFARRREPRDHPAQDRQDVMLLTSTTVSPATARLIRNKLQEITDALGQPITEGEPPVQVDILLGFITPG